MRPIPLGNGVILDCFNFIYPRPKVSRLLDMLRTARYDVNCMRAPCLHCDVVQTTAHHNGNVLALVHLLAATKFAAVKWKVGQFDRIVVSMQYPYCCYGSLLLLMMRSASAKWEYTPPS